MRIILALDPLSGSEEVVLRLAERSWPPGTIVLVLSVVRHLPPSAAELWFDAGGDIEVVRKLRRERARESAARTADLLRTCGLAVEIMVLDGSPAKLIVDVAKRWAADLILLAPDRRKIARWMLSRITRAVLSHAPCSVELFWHKEVATP